jgi:hypothetical protein
VSEKSMFKGTSISFVLQLIKYESCTIFYDTRRIFTNSLDFEERMEVMDCMEGVWDCMEVQ